MPSVAEPVETEAVCVDFGSTFTKAALVDLTAGRIVASASHPTTIDTDVLDGYDACLAALTEQDPRAATAEVLACSSAGGGLRIAVVGNEELVTAEAGRRVALSSGGKVVSVVRRVRPAATSRDAGRPGRGAADRRHRRRQQRGDPATPPARWSRAAGPARSWSPATSTPGPRSAPSSRAVPHVLADNVVPRIGVLAPDSARAAIREMFLAHVIGGKHLSARADFTSMVRGATPDVVLTGVELLAGGVGDVVVVDVGGATTDVHSVVDLDPRRRLGREVVATTPVTRTVEGDLGMRWSALTTVADLPELADAAQRAARRPGLPARHRGRSWTRTRRSPAPPSGWRCAGTPAGRRSWSAPRAGSSSAPARTCARSTCSSARAACCATADPASRTGSSAGSTGADLDGGWQLPRAPRVVVDTDYVLAAAGLLAAEHPQAAYDLAMTLGR